MAKNEPDEYKKMYARLPAGAKHFLGDFLQDKLTQQREKAEDPGTAFYALELIHKTRTHSNCFYPWQKGCGCYYTVGKQTWPTSNQAKLVYYLQPTGKRRLSVCELWR